MDYFQGVVTEFLRAKRSRFVNTEYMINLDIDGTYKRDRHWYCDAVAIDFADSTVHLCEITYSKTLHAVAKRLQLWCDHWPELVDAIRRDSSLLSTWDVVPRVFVPGSLELSLSARIAALKRPEACIHPMPQPIITLLEDVLPWKYRSWNGEPFVDSSDAGPFVALDTVSGG
jgi:hypothetical protein